ncbi:MAG: HAMP domain-containing histidine kinase [Lachnospiraceae bacterium]|nr:HAMP domain-containing histidine kinase [Lachnospiraceae bacterium]
MPEPIMAVTCAAFVVVHFLVTYKRYSRISRMCGDIDNIINGDYHINLDNYKEGELSVLSDEIYKVLSRLKDTAELLEKDKKYLSDSMADISHQLRTPLTSINILVSRLSEEDITNDRKMNLCIELRKKLTGIDNLIDVLLKMSKFDAGTIVFKNEEISVSNVINSAYDAVAVPMELKGQTFEYMADDCTICGDEMWLTESFSYIFKNCMEHTPENGKITVQVNDTALYTEIIIRDTGNGFEKEDIPHLFERFYKGQNASKDSFGIGLSLSRMIIVEQNGTIKADNYKDGARFTVRFYKQVV